uniref:Beta-defensin n=1 Tax=Ornithorhynchus anatinus TaxID=9258 RepID=A0A6I8NUJ8_ORNAN
HLALSYLTSLLFYSNLALTHGFQEICWRPNGYCRKKCWKDEAFVSRCLNGYECCLPPLPPVDTFDALNELTSPEPACFSEL